MNTITLEEAAINKVEVVSVIRLEFNRGAGVRFSPIRRVVAYYLMDGTFLIEQDPMADVAQKPELREQ